MSGTYIYGIVPSDDEVVFDIPGVDREGDVYTIPDDGLAAVVGTSARSDYRGLRREEVVPYLAAHQRVVEAVMQSQTVLPVKFGTVLPDDTWVSRLLQQGRNTFRQLFDELDGRVQIEIVVIWNLGSVLQEIAQEEPIVRARERASQARAEALREAQILVGQMVQRSLGRRRAAVQERILSALQAITPHVIKNGCMDDSMVANVALLVNEAQKELLDACLETLDAAFDGVLTFRCVGPLPPYSFATAQIQVSSFSEIDAARRLLDLGHTISLPVLRRAYHRAAARLHPDHNQEAAADDRMQALSTAYRLLRVYVQSQVPDGLNGDAQACLLTRQEIERSLLIDVVRQDGLLN